ncbi:MAG TPA: acyltransferase [Gemmataceae bacterium]|nr:acyltransferase [Gemmataceae bacterium]
MPELLESSAPRALTHAKEFSFAQQESHRPAKLKRYKSLDLWRGVACLLVVVYHSTVVHFSSQSASSEVATLSTVTWLLAATKFMNLGVPMFFVISGFCIAASADGLRDAPLPVRTFFARRFWRIYPPLWIAIGVFVAFYFAVEYCAGSDLLSSSPWAQLRPWWYSGWQWLGNLTLTESWRHHVVGGPRGHFPGQAWTLCYEEQFYLVTGLLLLFARKWFFLATMVVTFLVVASAVACGFLELSIDGFFFDGSWAMFAAGVLVFYGVNYAAPSTKFLIYVGLFGSACVSILALPAEQSLAYGFAFGFAIFLMVLHRWDDRLVAARILKPLFNAAPFVTAFTWFTRYLSKRSAMGSIGWGLKVRQRPCLLRFRFAWQYL